MGVLWVMLLLGYGFTGRATALVNHDLVPFGGLRRWIEDRYGRGSIQHQFIKCPWCVSMWWAIPASVAVYCYGAAAVLPHVPWPIPLAGIWFLLSWAVSLTAANLDPEL